MRRKRRQPTPGFRLPPPFDPITGQRADLVAQGVPTHCAMMQIVAEDEFKNYVICRGYDPRDKKFYDYEEEDDDKVGFPVAKPYGSRVVGVYTVGEIFPAVIPVTRIGQTAGVAADTDGHPADLDEVVEILYRDDSEDPDADAESPIAWLLLAVTGSDGIHWGKLDANLEYDDTTGVTVSIWSGNPLADSERNIGYVLPPPLLTSGQLDSGDWVKIERIDGEWYVTGAPC